METRNLINGVWRSPESGRTIAVDDPATGEILAEVPEATAADVRDAIVAAAAALPGWRARTADDRGAVLRRFAGLVSERSAELAELIAREGGKPIGEARGEVAYGRSFLAWAAEEATRVYGETVPSWHEGKRVLVLRQPVGVTASITPWNFPLAMITRKLGPALAAGCTQVVKPAPQTPLTALELGRLAVEAGVPAGVVNVVTAPGPDFAAAVFADARVRKVSFTGSTEVGRQLIERSAGNVTRLSLELGGHAPVIVFDDADLDAAVAGVLRAKFRNNGQSCIAANRIYVQRGIREEFTAAFDAAVGALRVGGTLSEAVDVGPLIDGAALRKVRAHVDDAVARGARLLRGGSPCGPGGRFFEPTVLDGVTDDMLIFNEETFGPVAALAAFDTEEEALRRANASPFGLAAYVFSRDLGRVVRAAEALEYGVVGVNDGAPSTGQAPFGGMKLSGYGREGGRYVMHEYLETKYVSLAL
ncbi:NAD-dependent succinate-semialdehyde dehydrogenase [Actinomadura rugatobispora]|uniref:NAD-dependent succinate-semialdehyde dehydrogenase n=1 Tax=Actinomadura rugatobispora TaxID=1994 RepID=A0ABW1AFB7_9ACTN